jgi:hypothetical protein
MAHVHRVQQGIHIGQDIALEPSDHVADGLAGSRHRLIEALGNA